MLTMPPGAAQCTVCFAEVATLLLIFFFKACFTVTCTGSGSFCNYIYILSLPFCSCSTLRNRLFQLISIATLIPSLDPLPKCCFFGGSEAGRMEIQLILEQQRFELPESIYTWMCLFNKCCKCTFSSLFS